MDVLFGIIQLVSIIMIGIYEYRKKSISIFMWATLLVMFGIPHLLSILINNIEYSKDVMMKASIFVILFNFFYLFTKLLLIEYNDNRINKQVKSDNESEEKNVLILSNNSEDRRLRRNYFIVLLISFLILVYYSRKYLGSLKYSSWNSLRGINSELGFRSLLRYGNFLFFSSAGVFLVYINYRKKFMSVLSLLLIIVYSLSIGNRMTMLPAIVAIIILNIFYGNEKLNCRKVFIFSVLGALTLYIINFLRILRFGGGFYKMLRQFNFSTINSQVFEMMLNGEGELGLRKAFYYFIYRDNDFANFNKGHTYIRLLLIAIPTFLIPGIKPPDFAISMGSAWSGNPYNTVYSMHPTLYGDCFANLWWFGIFLGIFWAIFSFLIDRFINDNAAVVKTMLMVLFGVAYVIVGRGSVYNGIFIAFIGTIIILSINLLSRLRL